MQWTVRLEARTSAGEVKTTELVTFSRPGVVSTLAEIGLVLSETKTLLARLQASMLCGRVAAYAAHHRACAACGMALTHMWTGPSSQGGLQCFDQIACAHMFGLLVRSHMNAGQDGFRDRGSKQHCDLGGRPLGQAECPVSWID